MKKNIVKIILAIGLIIFPIGAFCDTPEINIGTGTTVVYTKFEPVFDQQTVFDLSAVEMSALIIVAIIGSIFYFKNPGF